MRTGSVYPKPPADGPAGFATDAPWLAHAAYRGADGHVYEIMW